MHKVLRFLRSYGVVCVILLLLLSACGAQEITTQSVTQPDDAVQSGMQPEDPSESDDKSADKPGPLPDEFLTHPEIDDDLMEDSEAPPAEVNIPTLEEGAEQSMLVYDFLNSCLDWHVSLGREEHAYEWYILRYDKDPTRYYSDWYVMQDGFILPPCGSAIETHEVPEGKLDTFEKVLSQLPEGASIIDSGWTLYMFDWDTYEKLSNNGIPCHDVDEYTMGREFPFIVNGSGWPTEWLRREPYRTYIKDEMFDIDSSWWDTWNYRGVYQMVPHPDSPSQDYSVTLTCMNDGTFEYKDNHSGFETIISWAEVQFTCNEDMMIIPGIYDPFTTSIG